MTALLLMTALAGDPVWRMAFSLPSCDRVRSRLKAEQPILARELVVTITNPTDTTCTFKGVSLQGTLEGTVRLDPKPADGGQAFTLGPNQAMDLWLKPDTVRATAMMAFEIAPGSGIIRIEGS